LQIEDWEMQKKIETICSGFEPISLSEMDAVMFMDRIESKFSMHIDLLPQVLQSIQHNYKILEIDQLRIFPYSTLYYDTKDNAMFQGHHSGKFFRYKIRCRKYISCDLSFLEIKEKTTGDRTIKNRIKTDDIETTLSERSMDYLGQYTPFRNIRFEPKIYTNFSRLTLVSNDYQERATIDQHVHFQYNGKDHSLDNLVIVELKRKTHSCSSSMLINALRHYGITGGGVSKYCIGRSMLEKDLKSNNFRTDIRTINKINDGKFYYLNY
jgi:hypothetical protein